MQEIFLIRQDDRKPLRMKSTAKQENKFNFKRNISPKCVCILAPWDLQHIQAFDYVSAGKKVN